MKLFSLVVFMTFFIGCSHTIYQSDTLLKSSLDIPPVYIIGNVQFIPQTEHYCGPATLSMAMDHAGHPVPMQTLASEMYTPGQKGSFQTDLMNSARRNGMMAIQLDQKMGVLLQELAAGHPVIVFQNLGMSWYPIWHYALAVGYDLTESTIILHSGETPYHKMKFKEFEQSWENGKFWGIVVLSPMELSATASELAHVNAAACLEMGGKIYEAEAAYQAILERYPKSLGAHIGLGNVYYTQKKYKESARYLELATKYHPYSAIAWHNLAQSLGHLERKKEAKMCSEKALSVAGPLEKVEIEKSLEKWL